MAKTGTKIGTGIRFGDANSDKPFSSFIRAKIPHRRRQSISARWFINSFSVVAILLVIVDAVMFFVLRSYYYSAVTQYLQSEAGIIHGIFSYMDISPPELRRTVEEFDKKGEMELMAVNADGVVDMTSSGFLPYENLQRIPDYDSALADESGFGSYIGVTAENEPYMAVSVLLPTKAAGAYKAVRMVASLEKIDAQIYRFGWIIVFVSFAVLLVVLFLGLYFVRSIVAPIRNIGNVAAKVAEGDFSARLVPNKNNDELTELCLVINYMASELENAENIKNDFISSVSHELRTPLTAIKGWSDTLTHIAEIDGATLSRGLSVINDETFRLAGMVEELLDFSKIESGRFVLSNEPMDLLAELTDALLVYQEKAKAESVTIVYDEPDWVATIYGDKNRIRQVFINIIDNAIKYSYSEGEIVVTADRDRRAGTYIVTIKDNGQGIPADDIGKVKEKFYKAEGSLRGSGIGLSVADEIVSLHGGQLIVESEQGAGTVVRIVLNSS
ncbi:two-component sensor histidine kinase [Clostridia bacterium]|nr:two-component sensor histidine kinase [Clostridia bacterium]